MFRGRASSSEDGSTDKEKQESDLLMAEMSAEDMSEYLEHMSDSDAERPRNVKEQKSSNSTKKGISIYLAKF